jgi:hypothetical protein
VEPVRGPAVRNWFDANQSGTAQSLNYFRIYFDETPIHPFTQAPGATSSTRPARTPARPAAGP